MKGLFQCPPWARSFWAFSPYLNHMRNFSNVKGLDCEIFTKFLFQERHRIPINKKRPQPDFTCLITGAKVRKYFCIYLVRTMYAY